MTINNVPLRSSDTLTSTYCCTQSSFNQECLSFV